MVKTFGDFQFDDERRALSLRGKPVKLVGQALDLLVLLLERPGVLVTRDEIRDVLWPGRHVEFDHSLDVVVSRVRSVLDDEGTGRRFVETVPRQGYRFIEPVGVPEAMRSNTPRRWPRQVATYMAVAILGALAAILFARTRYEPFVQSRPAAVSDPVRARPVPMR